MQENEQKGEEGTKRRKKSEDIHIEALDKEFDVVGQVKDGVFLDSLGLVRQPVTEVKQEERERTTT
jgi:hypothetical protein